MEMVGHQRPGINDPGLFADQFLQAGEKVLPVFAIAEYFASFNPPGHYMVQNSRRI